MKIRLCFLVIAALGMFAWTASGQTAADEFERANSYYRDGKFDMAAVTYEAILRQGVGSAAIYFNLGNAYYRLGKTAPAILAYERALRLRPNDPDIRHNLELVNLKTADRIEPLPELFFIEWLRTVSSYVPLTSTIWIFVLSWLVLFSSLAALYLLSSPFVHRLFRNLTVASLVLLVPSGILLVTQFADARSHNDAIVVTSVATAKTSPDAQSLDAFVVHEGLKVKLSDSLGDWVKIILADGKVGWIRAQECERI
ncbi:MAG TPA: tetratricopeptide repeat protein [Bacteroidota bacterium]|nr:tetratricopeptide repeat protein [Bacteroidota bacterium]